MHTAKVMHVEETGLSQPRETEQKCIHAKVYTGWLFSPSQRTSSPGRIVHGRELGIRFHLEAGYASDRIARVQQNGR